MKTLKTSALLPRRKRSATPAWPRARAAQAGVLAVLALCAGAALAQPSTEAVALGFARPAAESVTVVEDEGVRIEETRVRGQLVRVQVQSKLGQSERYDIIVRPGRDQGQPRGSAGQSAWRLFSF